jgi:hypothetical protein
MQGSGSFRLIVRRGPQPNQIYELNKDSLTIGRDINNEIVINDPEVSRNHCRLTRGAGGYTLEDLGSTNGTFVNGQRLTGSRPLASSDMIGMGETVTLGYESTLTPAVPVDPQAASSGTMIGQRPQMPQGGQPGYGAQPAYGNPASGQQPYNPNDPYGGAGVPPAPPPQYGFQEAPPPTGGNTARFVFLGCGCLILLCIVVTIIALLYIDANNLYCRLPVLRNIVNIISTCPPVTP